MQRQKGQGRDYEKEEEEGELTSSYSASNQLVSNHVPVDLVESMMKSSTSNLSTMSVEDADESMNRVIRVASLAPKVTCEHLKAVFSIFGPITKIKV